MTTTSVTNRELPQSDRRCPSSDAFQRIADLYVQCRASTAFYRESLDILAQHFRSHLAAMNLCNAAESLDEHYLVGDETQTAWQRLTQAIMLESQADATALAKLYDIDGTHLRVAMLAAPLRDERQYRGACALIVNCRGSDEAESLLFELRTLVTLICSLASSLRPVYEQAAQGPDGLQRAISRAARFGSVTELAFAMTNGLKTKFHCDQVALGKVERGRVRLLSLSGMDALYPRSPGTRLIRQAMEECLDCGHTIYSRPGNDWSSSGIRPDFRLHRQWRSAVGDATVASIPLFADDQCVAILSVRRPGSVGFQAGELDEIGQLAGGYAPAMQLVERATRNWFAQTRDALRQGLAWFLVRNCWGRRLTAAAAVLLVTWFCMGTMDYRLATSCQLTPMQVYHCAAPFEGVLQDAHVEAGDVVKQGQLLYVMDTRDLELQRCELESEAAVLELEIAQASSNQQLEPAALARAKLQVAQARLAGVERRMALAEVRAPADGTIMAGDIERRVGDVVQLGEPLIEFAPHGSWGVELQVNSRDAQLVQAGQQGRFATLARPDQTIACTVQRIEPSAQAVNGQSVYVARARVTSNAAWTLAGMDGIATLDVGRRQVWWVALHRMIDYLRLHFWV